LVVCDDEDEKMRESKGNFREGERGRKKKRFYVFELKLKITFF